MKLSEVQSLRQDVVNLMQTFFDHDITQEQASHIYSLLDRIDDMLIKVENNIKWS